MRVHVAGAGLAGLAAALACQDAGCDVTVYDAARQAGGRCRSWHDPLLDRVIDNGSHLLLSGNHDVGRYLVLAGGPGLVPAPARFPMLDLASGRTRVLAAGLAALRTPRLLLDALKLLRAAPQARVADVVGRAWPWGELTEAVLNTAPDQAAAGPLAAVLRESLLRGAKASRPLLAPQGLGTALVEPAVGRLQDLRLGWTLTAIRADRLCFDQETVAFGPADRLILAVPPWRARQLLAQLPELPTSPIINAHFRLDRSVQMADFIGLTGGEAQWLFRRGDVLSVTVSAADRWLEQPSDLVAERLWQDCARALDLDPNQVPPVRVIKERRATLRHTPEVEALRPRQLPGRVVLAGDWVATGLPCTLEGAVRSGLRAADLVRA